MSSPEPALSLALARIREAYRTALTFPLSSRKTLLVAVLLDNVCDQAFAELRGRHPESPFHADDVLAFREHLRMQAPALHLIFGLCAFAPGSPRLETRAVAVPIEAYRGLSVEDFMVCLYNAGAVQRVVIVEEGGGTHLAHEVLGEAIEHLERILGLTHPP